MKTLVFKQYEICHWKSIKVLGFCGKFLLFYGTSTKPLLLNQFIFSVFILGNKDTIVERVGYGLSIHLRKRYSKCHQGDSDEQDYDPVGMNRRVVLTNDDPRLLSKTLAPKPPPSTAELVAEKESC